MLAKHDLLFFTEAAASAAQAPVAALSARHFTLPSTSGPYLGVRTGNNSIANSCNASYDMCDINNVGFGLFGGYSFTPWLSLELDATDYRSYQALYSGDEITADVKGYGVSMRLSKSLRDSLLVYSRIGASYIDINRNASEPISNASAWSLQGAVGLEYRLTPSLAMRVEYQHLTDIDGSNGHFTSLGLNYRFGQRPRKPTLTIPPPLSSQPVIAQQQVLEKDAEPRTLIQPANILFGFDKDKLPVSSQAALNKIALRLKQLSDVRVEVTGYTDNIGTINYNYQLSKRRALSVAAYLIKKGVSGARISTHYAGKANLIGNTLEKRAKNRRVELRLLTSEGVIP